MKMLCTILISKEIGKLAIFIPSSSLRGMVDVTICQRLSYFQVQLIGHRLNRKSRFCLSRLSLYHGAPLRCGN